MISVVIPWVKLADRLLVDQQIDFRLAEHVNETGRHHQARGVNRALGRDVWVGFADKRNAIADNSNICIDPGIAAAIHDAAIADERVVLLGKHRSCDCEEESGENQFMSWHVSSEAAI